ncbi:MAG: polysaccharide pyruvyl transferase family protein [Muribaculaceae bacterium]|nr:polysaccharide pyruvyl transferase family protein [Muribaculaceae bacterium]
MKIGILTYHKSHNYGALLQSVATRIVLESLGYEAYYVDYWPAYHSNVYKFFSFKAMTKSGFKGLLHYFLLLFRYWSPRKKRISNFNRFINTYIQPYCKSIDENFDLIVHGSDQIWRVQSGLKAYNPVYFGSHAFKSNRNISYAASMDRLPCSEKERCEFLKLVKHLNAISVREKKIQDFLNDNGIENVHIDLDPTLLVSGCIWREKINIVNRQKEKYILFYDLLPKSFKRSEIEKYAEYKDVKLITLYSSVRVKESDSSITSVGPEEFLGLIRDAEMVFTSSYHGLVFSILFNKQVIASFGSRQERAQTLLGSLGISERMLSPCSEFPKEFPDIDYNTVNSRLEQLKSLSIEYLKHHCSYE